MLLSLIQLADNVPAGRDAVAVDTPPLEERAGVVAAALRVASFVVVPMAPSPIEYATVRRRESREEATGIADKQSPHKKKVPEEEQVISVWAGPISRVFLVLDLLVPGCWPSDGGPSLR